MRSTMGLFEIPQLKRSPDGILGLVLGILLGGLGILITGLVAKHRNTTIVGAIMIGVSIAFYIVGLAVGMAFLSYIVWVWPLVWGIMIFMKSS